MKPSSALLIFCLFFCFLFFLCGLYGFIYGVRQIPVPFKALEDPNQAIDTGTPQGLQYGRPMVTNATIVT
jgi:hypothetical protein